MVDPAQPLTSFQESLLASVLPKGGRILKVRPHRHWDGRLTFPLYVRVGGGRSQPASAAEAADGEQTVLLRQERYVGGVETEATVLPLLARLGLPVPHLLAGPAGDPEFPERGAMSVLSLLPGTDLQHLSTGASPERVAALGALIFAAVDRLHAVSPAVQDELTGKGVPSVTLAAELQAIQVRGGPWLADHTFHGALERLLPEAAAEGERTPLVFSNGDYNAGNFLADGTDASGWRLTGIVDFARARFEDPYYGFAKYWTYDMQPFHGAGVIARGLETRGVRRAQLALRLAIRCLWTLQHEVPLTGHTRQNPGTSRYGEGLLALLQHSLAKLPTRLTLPA